MLSRLIYASVPRQALTPESVQAIVDHARVANPRRQLSGMLVFDSQAFLQVLEGRREAVTETFCRIGRDTRHERVVLIEMVAVDERLFARWSMGFAAAHAVGREQFQRFGGGDSFDPHAMTAASALGLLRALAGP